MSVDVGGEKSQSEEEKTFDHLCLLHLLHTVHNRHCIAPKLKEIREG